MSGHSIDLSDWTCELLQIPPKSGSVKCGLVESRLRAHLSERRFQPAIDTCPVMRLGLIRHIGAIERWGGFLNYFSSMFLAKRVVNALESA